MPRVFLVILISLPLAYANGLYASYKPIPAHHLEQAIFDLSNNERLRAGTHALIYDEQLALSARQHANEMAQLNYVSHESPVAENATLLQRVIQAGSAAQELGENVARFRDNGNVADKVVQGWLNSPGHRKNLLHTHFTHMGIGVAQDDDGLIYISQTLAYQPLVLQSSVVNSQVSDIYEATVEFSLKARNEVAILYGNKNTEPELLDNGNYHQTIILNSNNPIQIALGVRSHGEDFIFQDDGWLDPTNAYGWQAGSSGHKTYAQIDNVFTQARQERSHLVTLSFDKFPSVDYGVWVNDNLQQEARFNGTTLNVNVPAHLIDPIIELALHKGDNRYNSILRLILSIRGAQVVLEPASR